MDSVVDWIGAAGMGMLVEKIASYLSQNEKEMRPEMREELERLKRRLSYFQAALNKAQKQKNNRSEIALEDWIWQLRDAVEEAEDVMDDIEYQRIERQVDANNNKVRASSSSGIKRKFYEFKQKYWPKSNENDLMLRRLREVIGIFDAVKSDATGLIDIFNVATAFSSDNLNLQNDNHTIDRETGHILADDEFFGRDEEKKRILKWLMHTKSSEKISAMTICGMGGLGKTTLCQAIFNDETTRDHFKIKIWIYVSDQFDVIKVLTKAIEFVEPHPAPDTENLSVLQQRLLDIVKKKKFLLVLDDVWDNVDLTSWEKLVTPLKHGDNGSKILLTTRQTVNAEMFSRVLLIEKDMINLTSMDEDDCTTLFNKHAFVGVNPDDHKNLQIIGKKIIEKCSGLPLAVKIMGGLLRTNFNYSYWVKISEYDILQLEDKMKGVRQILKISYQHLHPSLQACFRFCSLYPPGYEFTKHELVNIWIGAGLIQQSRHDRRLIEDVGEAYLGSLQTRSFFELRRYYGDKKCYVMHDLLRELAQVISEGECLEVTGDKLNHIPITLRHLSVRKPNQCILNHLSNLHKLRTLHIDCNGMSPELINVLNEVLMQLKRLRILYLRNLPTIISLDAIRHLKYVKHLELHFRSDKTHWFPEPLICNLYHLQYLSYSCSCAGKNCLADGINVDSFGNLTKIRYLNLPFTLWKSMNKIHHLTEIREVTCYVKKETDFKLSSLKHLNKLYTLSIEGLAKLTCSTVAEDANLYAKEHLKGLTLLWTDGQEPLEFDPEFHEQVLDLLRPYPYLKDFYLAYYPGRSSPSWMTSLYLSSIVKIELRDCHRMEHLPPLGCMPFLKYLYMIGMPAIKQTGMNFYGNDGIKGFPLLEKLTIMKMENLEEWSGADNADWFPSLKQLHISETNKLKQLPSLPVSLEEMHLDNIALTSFPQWQHRLNIREVSTSSSPSSLSNQRHAPTLQELELWNSPNVTSLPCIQVFSTFTSLHTITLLNLERLMSLGGLRVLTSLKTLSINRCNNLSRASDMHMSEVSSTSAVVTSFPLQNLVIDDVELLHIEPLRSMTSAHYLSIEKDCKLESLASAEEWLLQNCTSLTALELHEAPFLRFLSSTFQSLCSSLQNFDVWDAPLLESLPKMPSSLKSLRIIDCPLLKMQYMKDVGHLWHEISRIQDVTFDVNYL